MSDEATVENAAPTKIRTLTGRVVSSRMDKTISVAGRASREAPDVWQVHQAHDEAHGA